jgi:hypothetical protein
MPTRHTYPRTEATSINAIEITRVQMWNKIIKAMPRIQQLENRSVVLNLIARE